MLVAFHLCFLKSRRRRRSGSEIGMKKHNLAGGKHGGIKGILPPNLALQIWKRPPTEHAKVMDLHANHFFFDIV